MLVPVYKVTIFNKELGLITYTTFATKEFNLKEFLSHQISGHIVDASLKPCVEEVPDWTVPSDIDFVDLGAMQENELIAKAVFKSLNENVELDDYGINSWYDLYNATVNSESGNEPNRYGFEYWDKEVEYSIFEDLGLESHIARSQLRAMEIAIKQFAKYTNQDLEKTGD